MQFYSKLTARVSVMALAAAGCAPALAQEMPADAPDIAQSEQPADDVSDNVIVVTAQRQRGAVDTDVPPVVELTEADIASYGADSLTDLIAQLAPQTGSARGRGAFVER